MSQRQPATAQEPARGGDGYRAMVASMERHQACVRDRALAMAGQQGAYEHGLAAAAALRRATATLAVPVPRAGLQPTPAACWDLVHHRGLSVRMSPGSLACRGHRSSNCWQNTSPSQRRRKPACSRPRMLRTCMAAERWVGNSDVSAGSVSALPRRLPMPRRRASPQRPARSEPTVRPLPPAAGHALRVTHTQRGGQHGLSLQSPDPDDGG